MLPRDAIPLLFAFVASLAIHFAAIGFFTNKRFHTPFAPPPDASHLETPRLEQLEIVLGIEESQASTLTWIGYDNYEKHLARLAQVEQASMQLKQRAVKSKPKDISSQFNTLAITTAPIVDGATKLLGALRDLQISFGSKSPPSMSRKTQIQEQNAEKETLQVAEPSELESDPTSIVEVPRESWKTGRPIAAEGIILRPRRPSFTAYQSVTNAPRGLTALLVIDHRGRPVDVEVISGTGSASIDRSLVASLYRWRAAGDKINALAEEETIKITIHISFSR